MPAPSPAADELPADIRGACVLLVEDNELNQMVAVELLLDAGFAVDVAENGQAALDCIERKAYDVVLMDMQMPVMDGETATRQLRGNPRHAALPIVAMTANAMEADRQRCFAAGMNDHVAKPIEPAALWAALRRWIRPRPGLGMPQASSAQAAAPAEAGRAADSPLPEVAGLDAALGLQRALGKPTLYVQMLRRFMQGQSAVIADIERALAGGDAALAERLAHTLRAVAANIGAEAVSAQAQALERALRGGGTASETLASLLGALDAALQPVLVGLQAWMPQPPAPLANGALVHDAALSAGVQRGAQGADAVLRHLRRLLEQDDPAAPEFFQDNAQVLKPALGDVFTVVELHTLNFDFEQALGVLDGHAAADGAPAPDPSAADTP